MPPQDLAFLAILAGALFIYCECIWIGRIYFGLAGAFLILFGITGFSKLPHSAAGPYLLSAAVLCFALEAAWRTFRLPAVAGTLLLSFCSWTSFSVNPALAFIASSIFGLITTALLSLAKQASLNKRTDL